MLLHRVQAEDIAEYVDASAIGRLQNDRDGRATE